MDISKAGRAALILVLLGHFLLASCNRTGQNGEAVAKPDIHQVVDRHANKLMEISGVTGVAVGAKEDGTPCVMVLILEDSEVIKSKLPDSLEGYPVTTFVSGTIEPMAGDSGG